MNFYDLSSNAAVFLPLEENEERSVNGIFLFSFVIMFSCRLPDLVKKHVKQASDFVFDVMMNSEC